MALRTADISDCLQILSQMFSSSSVQTNEFREFEVARVFTGSMLMLAARAERLFAPGSPSMNNHSLVSADDYLIIEHRVLPLSQSHPYRLTNDRYYAAGTKGLTLRDKYQSVLERVIMKRLSVLFPL